MDLVFGGVSVRLTNACGSYEPRWTPEADFVAHTDHPTISLTAEEVDDITLPPGAALIFDAMPLWTVYAVGGDHVLAVWRGDEIAQLVRVSKDDWTGVLQVRRDFGGSDQTARALDYPLLLLLASWRVAYTGGVMLHACGVTWHGCGVAFTGRSEAGKSTTSRLWRDQPDTVVLNDDRVIVQPDGQGFRLAGTPWHGDGEVYANASAPLRAILCVQHGEANNLEPLRPAEAAAEVIAGAVLPFYDREAMEIARDTCVRLACELPVMRYRFVPEMSAVDHVQQYLLAHGMVPSTP